MIVANWHGFECFESSRTPTIRSGPEGTPGTWHSWHVAAACSVKWWILSKLTAFLAQERNPGTRQCQGPMHMGPACQPDHSAFVTHDSSPPSNWKKQKGRELGRWSHFNKQDCYKIYGINTISLASLRSIPRAVGMHACNSRFSEMETRGSLELAGQPSSLIQEPQANERSISKGDI